MLAEFRLTVPNAGERQWELLLGMQTRKYFLKKINKKNPDRTCNLSMAEEGRKAEKLQGYSQSQLHIGFYVSLDYTRSCLRNKIKK